VPLHTAADDLALEHVERALAIVLSVDEKSQIQALDRTQPGLPLKPGRCGTTAEWFSHSLGRNRP